MGKNLKKKVLYVDKLRRSLHDELPLFGVMIGVGRRRRGGWPAVGYVWRRAADARWRRRRRLRRRSAHALGRKGALQTRRRRRSLPYQTLHFLPL